MLELLSPRVIVGSAGRFQSLHLDETIFARSRKLLVKALQGGKQLSRKGVFKVLKSGRISTTAQRGSHILWRLAQEGLLCFGARGVVRRSILTSEF